MRLTYHPEAEAELIEAASFYEGRSRGLGERFLEEFDAEVAAVRESPDRWPIVESDIRSCTMRRFPFGIYYRIHPDELHILVISHHSRHPDYWRHRLSD